MSDGKPAKCRKLENDVYKFEDPVLKSDEEKDYLILFLQICQGSIKHSEEYRNVRFNAR